MKKLILLLTTTFIATFSLNAQEQPSKDYTKHGVVWSGGVFKSWLTDNTVNFHQVGSTITPVFEESKKTGFAINSHYMYKPVKMLGIGIHLGIGLDVYSYIESPVLLFGGSISYGNNNQFIINFGWADAKRKKVTGTLRNQLLNTTYTEIPVVHQQTEVNTGMYLGISYKMF